MPSLLDAILARRNPHLGGVLGTDQVPREGRPGGGVLGPAPAPQGPAGPGMLDPGTTMPGTVNPPMGSQPTVPQQQQPARMDRVPGEQLRQQADQQLRARQNQRNREPGPGEEGLDFFGKLFVGRDVEGLTQKEQGMLKRQSLINAGLRMLLSSGRGHDSLTFGQALGAGILAGRQAATQTAGELLDEKRAQAKAVQYRRVFDNADLSEMERWEEARRLAVKRGDMDAVKVFNATLKELRETNEGELDSELRKGPDGRMYQVITHADGSTTVKDPFSNEVVDEQPAPPKTSDEAFQREEKLADNYRQEAAPLVQSDRLARSALQAPKQDPAAQQTLIMALNKLLSPNSTVRQSEFERVAQMGGLTAQAQQYWNRFSREGQLPEQVENSIRAEIERLHATNLREIQSLNQFYARRARRAGVDPRNVYRRVQAGGIGGDSQNGNSQSGARPSTGAGASGAPVLFPEDEEGGQ